MATANRVFTAGMNLDVEVEEPLAVDVMVPEITTSYVVLI